MNQEAGGSCGVLSGSRASERSCSTHSAPLMWTMGLHWVFFLALLIHVQAKNSNISVSLNQNATLICSLDISDVYWYMEVHSGFKSRIVRTFSDNSSDLFIITSELKFTTERSNVLKILNITAEDYRLYLCARKDIDEIVFQDTFKLVPDGPETTTCPPGDTCSTGENKLVLYASFSLNVLLLLGTGLASTCLCLKKRRLKDELSADTQENMEAAEMPQYEEIQLPSGRAPPAALPRDDIYSKAGFPQSMQPPQRHLGRY